MTINSVRYRRLRPGRAGAGPAPWPEWKPTARCIGRRAFAGMYRTSLRESLLHTHVFTRAVQEHAFSRRPFDTRMLVRKRTADLQAVLMAKIPAIVPPPRLLGKKTRPHQTIAEEIFRCWMPFFKY